MFLVACSVRSSTALPAARTPFSPSCSWIRTWVYIAYGFSGGCFALSSSLFACTWFCIRSCWELEHCTSASRVAPRTPFNEFAKVLRETPGIDNWELKPGCRHWHMLLECSQDWPSTAQQRTADVIHGTVCKAVSMHPTHKVTKPFAKRSKAAC